MNDPGDVELVERFRNGDETAFGELVRRHQEATYRIARRFLGNHDDADDVVQEVFIRVYERLKEFRGESEFGTWLYRITVNTALNHLRRRRVREFFRVEDLAEQDNPESERPDDVVQRSEERALIEAAIETLPGKQKAVFLLRYYDELPYEEIAAMLKTSVGGLKANYFHAVRKIEEYVRRAHGSS